MIFKNKSTMDFNPQISKDNNSKISQIYKSFKRTFIFKSLKKNLDT